MVSRAIKKSTDAKFKEWRHQTESLVRIISEAYSDCFSFYSDEDEIESRIACFYGKPGKTSPAGLLVEVNLGRYCNPHVLVFQSSYMGLAKKLADFCAWNLQQEVRTLKEY